MGIRKLLQRFFSIGILILFILFFISSFNVKAQESVNNGINWLMSSQNPDGSWSEGSRVFLDTYTSLESLLLLNVDNHQVTQAIIWVENQIESNTDDIAHKVFLLSLAGEDVTSEFSTLFALMNNNEAWGADQDFLSDVLDTTLAIKAFDKLNVFDQDANEYTLPNPLAYLLSTQNSDGGWGFYDEDESNVYMTASVLKVIIPLNGIYNLQNKIDNAVAYLLTKQNADGGFGSSPSTVYETALALESLIISNVDLSTVAPSAENYLITSQLPNGSWEEDPYSTALALRALAYVKPNLSISSNDITFSNYTPVDGETIDINAIIHNDGPGVAENVVVRFFDGDPDDGGVFIDESPLSSISAYGNATTSVQWTIPSSSARVIFVRIDPSNVIDELNETDNIASKNVAPATIPDVSITSADISVFPPSPYVGLLTSITAKVRNHGETDAFNVLVEIYNGDPAAGGTLLNGSGVVAIIPAGGVVNVGAAMQPITGGYKDIHVLVDPLNTVNEFDETNNSAIKTFIVGAAVDLYVTHNDLSFVPMGPREGDLVEISATIHNAELGRPENITVRFYHGDPEACGIQIGSDIFIPEISGRGSVTVTTTFDTTDLFGNVDIYVWADPDDTIVEEYESNTAIWGLDLTNNIASKILKVGASQGPDLTLTSSDITFVPQIPAQGDIVTITANISNLGNQDAENILVGFYSGEPGVEGTTMFSTDSIPYLAVGEIASVQTTLNTAGLSGTYDIYVNADPYNEKVETDELNNMAFAPLTIEGQGPDLTISTIDATNLVTDTQSLELSGIIQVNVSNLGDQSVSTPFLITVFVDKDNDGVLDRGTNPFDGDNILSEITYSDIMAADTTSTIDLPLTGNVLFRDSLIYVVADSENAIDEYDETNNTRHTGQGCEDAEPVRTFNPVEKWAWTGSDILPDYNQVTGTPVVAQLTDDNSDGLIDEKDIPDIIFRTRLNDLYAYETISYIRAISGDDGSDIFTVTDPDLKTQASQQIAVGDIDGDGIVEILYFSSGTVALEHDGTFKWRAPYGGGNNTSISIADIDNDGAPEILPGNYYAARPVVLNSDGTLKWRGKEKVSGGFFPVGVDLDLDGDLEVVVGAIAYDTANGDVLWSQKNYLGTKYVGVANLDDDPYPELVMTAGRLYILEHDGTIKFAQTSEDVPYGGGGGPPTIADFDGDGEPEIGVAYKLFYIVYETDGSKIWETAIVDTSSWRMGSTAFDFDGDGIVEVLYQDHRYFRIYRGTDGFVLFETPNSSGTLYEYPIVADIDNDNHAEIVMGANDIFSFSWINGVGFHGIRVFEDANDSWVNTRKIWNQYAYYITNVNDNGTIPQYEEHNWEIYNNYRCNSIVPDEIVSTPDISASYITVDQTDYPASVSLSVRIGNGGAESQPAGVEVAFYDGDPEQGGTLIGTALPTIELNPGDYEDVLVIWNSPSAGSHTVFAIADKDNLIVECRENNNSASADIFIDVPPPVVYLPDLSIAQEDITIIPPDVIEGQDASIGVVVHNEGNLTGYNIEVAFYDGSASTGDLIGTASITSIDPEGTSYVQVPWSTYGQSGRNYIHVIADLQNVIEESNENNNESFVSIDVAPPTLPDLTVTSTDISFSHQTPEEGDPLTLTVTVHNIGTDSDTIKVDLYDGDPGSGGTLLDTFTIATFIPFGGQAEITFSIDTIGFTGNHSFHVVVDPENTIAEQREDNNNASSDLLIGTIGLDVTETTDKTQYNENEDVLITVSVTDLQNEIRELQVDVKVFDANGYLTASLDAVSVTVNPLATETVNFTWNTGIILVGEYSVRTTVYDSVTMNPVAKESVPISIAASAGISSNLVLDKISYNANEQVTITSTVTNDSVNEIYENLTATVTIQDSLSQVLFTEDTSIGLFALGAYQSFNSYWNTSTNPPGDYPVIFEVKDSSGTVLSTSTKILTITDVIDPSALLVGNISVDLQSLFQGDPVNISYSITNIGNIDLSQVDLSILTVHVVELTPYDTLTDQTALLMGETYNNTQLLNTPTYSAKDYLVILRANISGTEETLAGTYFRVEGAPSAPSLSSPGQGDDVETFTPILEVNNSSDPNDDEVTYEFELYSDSGLTNLVALSGVLEEGEGVTSWQVPVELVENETYYWRARAYDQLLYGEWMTIASFRVNTYNDLPTAPTLSSPADTSEVDTFTPILVVNNSYDPDSTNLTYNFEVASDPDFLNIVASVIGVFEGDGTTSWQVPDSILSENTHYYWRVQADDWLDEGPWMDTAMFFVNTANDAPSAPTVISPLDDSEITALSTDIIVSNSTDPDYDPLTYLFEVDTTSSFDSPNLMQSVNIPEGIDTTSWYVDGFSDNTDYYTRAKASDGLAESQWSGVIDFFVNTANDAPTTPVLANPSDGAGVNVFTPTLSVHNSTDIDKDVLTYEFEVYDETMTSLISSVTGVEETPDITSWTVPMNLTENEIYTWRARAYDAELYSGWMPFASFMINTANDAPSAPTLNAPAEGSSIETEYPTLSVNNSTDPDSDTLTYDFEIYTDGILVDSFTGIPEDVSGVTLVTLINALSDNTTYTWRARAYDGDRYGAWMNMATFTVHLPIVNITGTIDFDPNTLNQGSNGKWVTVYIELPEGYDVNDIIISSILLENTVPAEPKPYAIEDYDNDGIPDLKVKFRRSDVIAILPLGDNVQVLVTGELETVTFDGIDIIRVIQ